MLHSSNFEYVTHRLPKTPRSRLIRHVPPPEMARKMAVTLAMIAKDIEANQMKKAFVRVLTAKRRRIDRFSCLE